MQAYNKSALDNLDIQAAAAEAYRKKCITEQENAAIQATYPVELYTPNPYIRIGLFILTAVIVTAALGLLTLMTLSTLQDSYSGFLIFTAIITYIILELFVHAKKHYKSGVDDALLWAFATLLLCGIYTTNLDMPFLTILFCVFIISLFATLRFADSLMAVIVFLSLLGLVFKQAFSLGEIAKSIIPFILMAISLGAYLLMRRGEKSTACRHYKNCFSAVELVSLVTLYIAGNYFVVRELSNEMFHLQLEDGQSIPFGWLFWIFTIAIPLVYIGLGLLRKNTILLRTGLLLVAGTVITIRHYHSVAPLEMVMLISGFIFILIAYVVIKYLKTPKHGITYENTDDPHFLDKLQLESLIIAETFSPQAPAGDDFQFGGGTGGGGGATGTY